MGGGAADAWGGWCWRWWCFWEAGMWVGRVGQDLPEPAPVIRPMPESSAAMVVMVGWESRCRLAIAGM